MFKRAFTFMGVGAMLMLLLVVFVSATSIPPSRVVTATDKILYNSYLAKSVRMSELATAWWDTTNVTLTSDMTIDFTSFVTDFTPFLISMYSDANATVTYYGSSINARTGADSVVSFLRADLPQNWRLYGIDSLKISPSTSATVDIYVRGVIDK
jgi:hypothetical protein